MRQIIAPLCAAFLVVTVSGCDKLRAPKGDDVLKDINVVDDTNLNEVMMTVADADEAVAYFQRALKDNPGRIDLQRGLGASLVRAGRADEAVPVYTELASSPQASHDDRVDLAGAQIRAGDWDGAEKTLNQVPPTYETFKRYRLEAMVADSNKDWKKADSFYAIAVGLTTKPAGVLNNWGYSNLTRGNFKRAESLFSQAVRNDPTLFTAKNNLVIARSAQRKYDLPVVPMTQIERAQLLHTAGLSAVKQGDISTARGLFRDAVETHPQHFDAAARALAALG